jgi:hypothetical protein
MGLQVEFYAPAGRDDHTHYPTQQGKVHAAVGFQADPQYATFSFFQRFFRCPDDEGHLRGGVSPEKADAGRVLSDE